MKRKLMLGLSAVLAASLLMAVPVMAAGDGLIGGSTYEDEEFYEDSDSDNGDGLSGGQTYEEEEAQAAQDAFEELDLMMEAISHVNMRQTPNGEIVGILEKGQDIHVIGNMNDLYWYMCEYNGKTVYIYDDYLVPELPQMMVATHNVNVRVAPGTSAAIIGSLAPGDMVKVSDMENGWYKFRFKKTRQIGYSYGNYLAAVAG